jgi:ferredoxin
MGRFAKLVGKVIDKATGQQSELHPVDGVPEGAGAKAGGALHPLDPVPAGWNQAIKESPDPASNLDRVTVRFAGTDLEIDVPGGTTLLDAAIEADADLNHYCGGMCSCGSCRLEIISGEVSAIEAMEVATLDIVREGEADRLGCQTRALGDVVVRIPAD